MESIKGSHRGHNSGYNPSSTPLKNRTVALACENSHDRSVQDRIWNDSVQSLKSELETITTYILSLLMIGCSAIVRDIITEWSQAWNMCKLSPLGAVDAGHTGARHCVRHQPQHACSGQGARRESWLVTHTLNCKLLPSLRIFNLALFVLLLRFRSAIVIAERDSCMTVHSPGPWSSS